jgi:hypothetical protein
MAQETHAKCGYPKDSVGHHVECLGMAPVPSSNGNGATSSGPEASGNEPVQVGLRKIVAKSDGVAYADVLKVMTAAAGAGLVTVVSEGGRAGAVYAAV